MIGRLWKSKRSAADAADDDAGALAPAERFEDGATCTDSACTATKGWYCAYVDETHTGCESRWCADHVTFVGAIPLCRRHARVMKTLAGGAGTINEVKRVPRVDDRGVALVTLIAQEVDEPMRQLLRSRYSNLRDARVAADDNVRPVLRRRRAAAERRDSNSLGILNPDRELFWEWTWAAFNPQGYLMRVIISVPAAEPPEVSVSVNGDQVFSAIPGWIQRRLQGEPPNAQDRSVFTTKIIDSVSEALTRTGKAKSSR